jgi:flagellar motor switch protein FliM
VTPSMAEPRASSVAPVDFRRPSRIGRDAIVALESAHDTFARRLSTAWSSSSYAAIEIEHVATDQLSIDDLIRSLPLPTALATLRVGALGAVAFLQIDLPFALLYVERLLGGPGDAALAPIARRPTDLETALLTHELLGPAVTAVDEALKDLGGEPSSLLTFETVPQPLQLGSPGELLLLLTYRAEVRGELPAQGMITLAYPVAPLVGQLERLVAGKDGGRPALGAGSTPAATEALLDASVDLHVRLGGSALDAAAVSSLSVGDVLRLDHAIGRPAQLVLDDRDVGTAYLGVRGRRLAAQIAEPPCSTPDRRTP